MKRFLIAILGILMLCLLASCGGNPQDTVVDTTDETAILDFASGNYKIVYDITDSNSITLMSEMIAKIEGASYGVKFPSANSSNPESEYEIQFGLKSGRADSEAIYNEMLACSNDVYGAFAIRAIGNKIIIAASDNDALKMAADKFANSFNYAASVAEGYNTTALFNRETAKYGNLELITDFASNTELGKVFVDGKPMGIVDGKNDYFRTSEGKAIPAISVETKYPGAKVETTKQTDRYDIKITSADGTKEEEYHVSFIETAPLDKYDLNTWIAPYWEGCITYHESVMFVGDDGAPLMYAPEHVLSVRSSDLKTEYVEGVDYEIKDGKIYRLNGSAMPSFTWDEFYPKSKETSVSGNAYAGSKKPYVFFAEGTYFHTKQVFVTYTHQENSSFFVPTRSTKLTSFEQKLKKGESVNLVFFGDSITAGGNASGRNGGVAPFTPIWAEIVRDALVAKYPSAKINYTNTAVGGKETVWAIEELEARVNAYKPDLLVLAFGMNDGGKTTAQFIANIKTIVDRVLAANPDCEIALIATMLPHAETTYFKNQDLQEAALYELAKSYKNVDVIPMTSVHASVLGVKRYFDMTGNNVNHAGDFLVRIYAQTILETIVG